MNFGLIEDEISEFGFQILCVVKKYEKLRIYRDYRTLNEQAVHD